MSMYPNPYGARRADPYSYEAAQTGTVATFMNLVYAWMCVGLAVTAVVAWYVSTLPLSTLRSIYGAFWILVIAELGLVFAISYAVNKISSPVAMLLFLLYAVLNGLTLSGIFLIYNLGLIGVAFAATAGMFGAMSLIGFVTKKDLTSLGGLLLMGLIGIIIASVVNIFVANSTLTWIISYLGVAIFLGLTAYDTQKLKRIAYQTRDQGDFAHRLAIVGSLTLYLDFINLFLFILQILGRSKD